MGTVIHGKYYGCTVNRYVNNRMLSRSMRSDETAEDVSRNGYDCTAKDVSDWRNGRAEIPAGALPALAAVFECAVIDFFDPKSGFERENAEKKRSEANWEAGYRQGYKAAQTLRKREIEETVLKEHGIDPDGEMIIVTREEKEMLDKYKEKRAQGKEYSKRYYEAHKEYYANKKQEWYRNNRERADKVHREWLEQQREKKHAVLTEDAGGDTGTGTEKGTVSAGESRKRRWPEKGEKA